MSAWKSDVKLLIFASLISPGKSFSLRSNIKHSTQCFIFRRSTWKFVKPLRVVFSSLFSVFHSVMKHSVSRLIYYIKHKTEVVIISSKLGRVNFRKDFWDC